MSSSITVKYRGGTAKTVNLPIITNIEDVFNVMLTETSTIIYGYRNRFVMDLGTKRQFTLTCERVNPPNYNDSSDNWDDWSNGKWMTEFIALLDPWQNLMGQQEGEKKSYVGGFTLNLDSCDTSLYPDMVHNVFLNGSISPTYGVQVMKFSLPLSVGRMTGTDAKTDFVTVTLHANDGTSKTITQTYPKGSRTAVPSCPASWTGLVKQKTFYAWTQGSTGGATIFPGQIIQWNTNLDLYVKWKGRIGYNILTYSSDKQSEDFTAPSGTNRCTIYMVGGGGGGGSSNKYTNQTLGISTFSPGGGGGAGQFIQTSFSLTAGSVLSCTVGKGGAGSSKNDAKENGEDGEASSIVCGSKKFIAEGGEGGEGQSSKIQFFPVKGGQRYYAGGDSGQDGTTDTTSDTPGIPGKKAEDVVENVYGMVTFHGGAGGGAAPLNHAFLESSTYTSRGGNGVAKGEPGDGIYGGGGGTSADSGGGDGGNGLIWIDYFE